MIPAARAPCDRALVQAAPETPGCASHARRWVLAAAVLGSSLAFLEASVINVALPAIQAGLRASVREMQWVASAYTVLLAALTLAGGAAGDRFGRRRVFQAGTVLLALASIGGSLAPDARSLIAARAAQGFAAALLVPNSLALLSGAFPRAERSRAVGTWAAATSLVGAVGPLLGGFFVDTMSWRVAFASVVPAALVALALCAWRVPDPPGLRRPRRVDWTGAALATAGLSLLVSGLIGFGDRAGMPAWPAIVLGAVVLAAFARHETRTPEPMVPAVLLASRAFVGLNVFTALVYAGVTGVFFLLPFVLVQLQGYSSTATGAAFLPFAALLVLLSRPATLLAGRIGIRRALAAGSLVAAAGLAGFVVPGHDGSYWTTFFVPIAVTGIGMGLAVAPLTGGVLAAVPASAAGVASGVNNAAARIGALLAVATVGVAALALSGRALDRRLTAAGVPEATVRALVESRAGLTDVSLPSWVVQADAEHLRTTLHRAVLDGFRGVVLLCAAVVAAGALVAWGTLPVADARARDDETEAPRCAHLGAIADPPPVPQARACVECLRIGQRWVHLRLCLTCGHVGCCDSSRNRHATAHFWASRHPIVRSLEPGEDWRWCYVDETVA